MPPITRQRQRQQKLSDYFLPQNSLPDNVTIIIKKSAPIAKKNKRQKTEEDDEEGNVDDVILRHRNKKVRIIDDTDEEDSRDEVLNSELSDQDKRESSATNADEDEEEEDNKDIKIDRRLCRKKRRLIADSDEETFVENNEDVIVKDTAIESTEDNNPSESQDIKEDLDFLDKSDILDQRIRVRQSSRYSQALKKLKDRKSKLSQYDQVEKGPIESYTTQPSNTAIVIDDTDDSSEHHSNATDSFAESEEEEGFVVDDDVIDGVKSTAKSTTMELPPEFSKQRVQSFNGHLKTYIEYLVELILNPVFDIATKPWYEMSKQVVLRRVQGYKDSMVTSDAWLPPFKEAVDKHVNWKQTGFIHIDSNGFGLACEACRSNKPASIQITLSSNDRFSDPTVLYLGTECCRKGEMYHHFYHFQQHMYQKVKKLVDSVRRKRKESTTEAIFEHLLSKGYVYKLTKNVKKAFNDVVMIYNLQGQRARVDDLSSSEDE